MIYGLPLWGILSRSHQRPASFLSLPIYTVPSARRGGLSCWRRRDRVHPSSGLGRELRVFGRRRADAPHSAYIVSHIAIFSAGYLLIDEINTGWLVLNIWHNLPVTSLWCGVMRQPFIAGKG